VNGHKSIQLLLKVILTKPQELLLVKLPHKTNVIKLVVDSIGSWLAIASGSGLLLVVAGGFT
jgi:hypothetical protein